MTPDERYPIEKYIMTKNDCYKAGKIRTPSGIQVHSVGCKGTDRDRWRRWNVGNLKKCANAIIDTRGIMQTLPWDMRPWLSGSGSKGNANNTHVGFEICEPSQATDTDEAAAYLYGCVRYLCAELCRDYDIRPENIRSHAELHRDGLASNHADVGHWWGKKGTAWEPYTMDRLRADVAHDLGEEWMPMETLRRGSLGESVTRLQELLKKMGYDLTVDGIYGKATEAAVRTYQESRGLRADGICGPATWGKLTVPDQPELPEDADEIPEGIEELAGHDQGDSQEPDEPVDHAGTQTVAGLMRELIDALEDLAGLIRRILGEDDSHA